MQVLDMLHRGNGKERGACDVFDNFCSEVEPVVRGTLGSWRETITRTGIKGDPDPVINQSIESERDRPTYLLHYIYTYRYRQVYRPTYSTYSIF